MGRFSGEFGVRAMWGHATIWLWLFGECGTVSKLRGWRWQCALVGVALAFASGAYGQGKTQGHILGIVVSSTGPVADAKVTAWHIDTSRTRTAVSGADGRYRFPGLAVGRYAVTGVVGNWQTSTIIAEVNVGEGTVVDLQVESPRVVEEVVVVADPLSPVDVTSSETTRIVTAGDIERLPITRDPNAVVLMAPGAGLWGHGVRHRPAPGAVRHRFRLRLSRRRLRRRERLLHQRHERDELPHRSWGEHRSL